MKLQAAGRRSNPAACFVLLAHVRKLRCAIRLERLPTYRNVKCDENLKAEHFNCVKRGASLYLIKSHRAIDRAGWSSLVARRAHNPEVVGSNPAPATKHFRRPEVNSSGLFLFFQTLGGPEAVPGPSKF